MKERASAEEKLGEGPSLQLAIPTERFLIGESVLSVEKEVNLASKPKRKFMADDVDDARQDMLRGHVALTDSIFEKVGGAIAHRAGMEGGFVSPTKGAGPGILDAQAVGNMASNPKKHRHFEADREVNKAIDRFKELIGKCEKELIAAASEAQKVTQDLSLVEMREYHRYISSQQVRLELVNAVLNNCAGDQQKLMSYCAELRQGKESTPCVSLLTELTESLQQTFSNESPDDWLSSVVQVWKPTLDAAGSTAPINLLSFLNRWQWTGSAFASPPRDRNVLLDGVVEILHAEVMQLLLKGVVKGLKDNGKPLPLDNPEKLLCMLALKCFAQSANDVVNEDDLKVMENTVKGHCQIHKKLCNFLRAASSDISKAIKSAASGKDREKRAAEKAIDAERKKRARAEDSAIKRVAKQIGKDDGHPGIFSLKSGLIVPMCKYDALKEFVEADRKQTHNRNAPYVIKNCFTLKSLVESAPLKVLATMFRAQFPTSELAVSTGRAQCPLRNSIRTAPWEAMMEMAPASALKPSAHVFLIPRQLQPVLQGAWFWGCTSKMCWSGTDQMALAGMRFVVKGSREVVYVPYKELAGVLDLDTSSKDVAKAAAEAMRTLSAEDIAALEKGGVQMHRAVLEENDVCYCPMGWILTESVPQAQVICFFGVVGYFLR